MVNSSWQSMEQDESCSSCQRSEPDQRLKPGSLRRFTSRLKVEAAIFENIVGDSFGGDNADRMAISDDRHVAVFGHGNFVDEVSNRVYLYDYLSALAHSF